MISNCTKCEQDLNDRTQLWKKIVLNFQWIFHDRNYSKFNITLTLSLKYMKISPRNPLIKGFLPIPRDFPIFSIKKFNQIFIFESSRTKKCSIFNNSWTRILSITKPTQCTPLIKSFPRIPRTQKGAPYFVRTQCE